MFKKIFIILAILASVVTAQNIQTVGEPADTLHQVNIKIGAVGDTYVMPVGNGTAGQLLKTDGSKTASWAAADSNLLANDAVTSETIKDNQIKYNDLSTAMQDSLRSYASRRFVYSITIDSTAILTTRIIPFFYASFPVTIDTVLAVSVSSGSPSVVFNIVHDDTMAAADGALVINTPGATTSKTVGTRYTTFTDATLTYKEYSWIKFTTVTTAPQSIIISIIGRR